jgi:hypothetical protein
MQSFQRFARCLPRIKLEISGFIRFLNMTSPSVKQEAQRIIEELAEDATWDDLMYRIYVRQAIESGLQDSEANRTLDVKEVRARFGLKS